MCVTEKDRLFLPHFTAEENAGASDLEKDGAGRSVDNLANELAVRTTSDSDVDEIGRTLRIPLPLPFPQVDRFLGPTSRGCY